MKHSEIIWYPVCFSLHRWMLYLPEGKKKEQSLSLGKVEVISFPKLISMQNYKCDISLINVPLCSPWWSCSSKHFFFSQWNRNLQTCWSSAKESSTFLLQENTFWNLVEKFILKANDILMSALCSYPFESIRQILTQVIKKYNWDQHKIDFLPTCPSER